ncbi:MAG: trypsin-like serine protease [Acidobacteria bacterium]|nr:trypsin-like serine protease [Acidobacteriota bacterium]
MQNFVVWMLLGASALHGQNALKALSGQFEELVIKTDPAVVQIVVRTFASSDDETASGARSAKGNGSGAIVSPDGYVVTNAHVVANARRIQVLLPRMTQPSERQNSVLKASGKLVNAELIGQDKETDNAVLKIEGGGPMPHLQFADSEMLREGQLVFAFGSPLGLDNSVTMGIVSATARQVRPEDPMIYIQTDAAINPENSGGPLVDSSGKLVGVNTFILTNSGGSEGIGFAAPSNIVKGVYEQIRESGWVRRGQIGVLAQTINPFLAEALGAGARWGGVD